MFLPKKKKNNMFLHQVKWNPGRGGGARGRKKGFPGAVRGAELIPAPAFDLPATGLWVASPGLSFLSVFTSTVFPFPTRAVARVALSIFVLGGR